MLGGGGDNHCCADMCAEYRSYTTPDAPIDALLPASGLHSSTAEAAVRAAPWEGGPLAMARRPECYLLWLCMLALQGGGLFLTVNPDPNPNPNPNPNPDPDPDPNPNPNPNPNQVNLGSMVQSRSGGVAAATAVTVFS